MYLPFDDDDETDEDESDDDNFKELQQLKLSCSTFIKLATRHSKSNFNGFRNISKYCCGWNKFNEEIV